MDLCRRAIDISASLKSGYYSAHAGFTHDLQPAHLGRPDLQAALSEESINKRDICLELLIESARDLADYGRSRGIVFLMENNVAAPIMGEMGPKLLLCLTGQDLVELVAEVNHDNFGLLIDVGHLKVTANALKFDRHGFIDLVGPHIKAWHLSDNDGLSDQHLPLSPDSWFLPRLKEFQVLGAALELTPTDVKNISSSIRIVENA